MTDKTALQLEDLNGTMSAIYDELATIAQQLTRIADALQRPEHATHNMADDGLDVYRLTTEIDRAFSEVAPREFYTGECIYPDDGTCNGCQYYSNCAHIHIAQGDE